MSCPKCDCERVVMTNGKLVCTNCGFAFLGPRDKLSKMQQSSTEQFFKKRRGDR